MNVPGSLSSALQQMYFGFGRLLVDELPLHAGRKAGAPAPAQPRALDGVDDLVRRHPQGLAQPGVASLLFQVGVESERVLLADVADEDGVHELTSSWAKG